MRKVLRCGFQDVETTFLRPSTLENGKKLWQSGHVYHVEEVFTDFDEINSRYIEEEQRPNPVHISTIKARITRQTNVNLESYEAVLKVNKGRRVIESYCNCLAGKDQCKHIAAVCYFINNDEPISKTNEPQEWGKPSNLQKEKYKKGKQICAMFPPPNQYSRSNSKLELLSILEEIKDLNCPLRYLLEAEQISTDITRPSLREARIAATKKTIDSIFSNMKTSTELTCSSENNYEINLQSEHAILYKELELSEDQRKLLCLQTLMQSSCFQWLKERECRITSTKSARIVPRKRNYPNLAVELLSSKRFKSTAMKYGIDTEKEARLAFEKLKNVSVKEVGLIVSETYPWLACSPDGVIFEEGKWKSLEIKCPYSCKEKGIIDWGSASANVPYLKLITGIGFELSKKHAYYSQVQISMFVLNLQSCYFYLYSRFENDVYLEIERDNSFLKVAIPKLESFYFSYYLPSLFAKKNVSERMKISN